MRPACPASLILLPSYERKIHHHFVRNQDEYTPNINRKWPQRNRRRLKTLWRTMSIQQWTEAKAKSNKDKELLQNNNKEWVAFIYSGKETLLSLDCLVMLRLIVWRKAVPSSDFMKEDKNSTIFVVFLNVLRHINVEWNQPSCRGVLVYPFSLKQKFTIKTVLHSNIASCHSFRVLALKDYKVWTSVYTFDRCRKFQQCYKSNYHPKLIMKEEIQEFENACG